MLSTRHCLSALFGACIALTSLSAAFADDTEIFFGQSADSFKTNPNVLFVLDTSGSMGWFDEGIELNRIDRLKLAMGLLLDQSSNFNVGLMGFQGSNSGGAIYYPVVDLEDDSSSDCPNGVCPNELVVVRPGSANDDATQNDDTKQVTLNAQSLRMANVEQAEDRTRNTGNTIDGTSVVSAISAEYENGSGTDFTRSIPGANQWFYSGYADSEDDHYAYRFENVAIPPGATVTSAKIVFTQTSSGQQVGDVSTYISLEATATPDPLPTTTNGLASLSDRLDPIKTTPGVAWENIPPYVSDDPNVTGNGVLAGGKVESPDLSEMITQVVNLPGWQNGGAVSFLFDPFDEYAPSAADVRVFQGINASNAAKPTLVYSYSQTLESEIETTESVAIAHIDELTEQNTGTISRNQTNKNARVFYAGANHEARKLAFRFNNIAIPNDAIIKTATLSFETSNANAVEDNENKWAIDSSTVPETNTDNIEEGSTSSGTTAPTTGRNLENFNQTGNGTGEENFTITANISAETTGTPATYNTTPLRDRDFTSEFVAWEEIDKTPATTLSSPDFRSVVESVINKDSWYSGNALSIMLSAPDDYENVESNSVLFSTSTSSVKPTLRITWEKNTNVDTNLLNTQTTAIRFKNVNVPPGAVIKSAQLVFYSHQANIEPTVLDISAEDNAKSLPFKLSNNDIGDRLKTTEREPWTVDSWETVGNSFKSPDISKVIQAVTSKNEWCAGNPLTVFLKGSGLREAISFDQNPVKAPSLRIAYAPDTVPDGAYCSNTVEQTSIVDARDDAVENVSTKNVRNTTTTLDTISNGAKQSFGLRFPGINLPADSSIVSAELQLTAASDIQQAQTFTATTESALTSSRFQNLNGDISNRSMLGGTAQGTISPGSLNETVLNINITSLVQEKVSTADWVSGEALSFKVDSVTSTPQSFYAFEGGEAYAPRLVIYYQSERSGGGTLTRDNLKEIVNNLVATGGTPIVGAYYEAAQYFAGGNVDYGLKRGNQWTLDRYHRVSHPESYTGGEVLRDPACIDSDLNAQACITEEIVSGAGGTPIYDTPINSECQQNHIVLLSDGDPTSNTAQQKVRNLTKKECVGEYSEECGIEIAQWLNEVDLASNKNGVQNVTTHTIGFNLQNEDFLKSIASYGGGGFYSADSAEDLLNAFKNIFINVSKTDTSFVAPSATVSQQNRMKNRDDLYFALFRPEPTARWPGNLKRYKLGGADDTTAKILDVNGNLAVDAATGNFVPTSRSFWSSETDGGSVLLGGAAEHIEQNGISHLAREVYTFTGTNPDLTNDTDNALLPDNSNINREWLKLPPTLSADDDYVENLLNWAHGKDVFDIDGDLDTNEARGQMGDPMHSQPLLVNYSGGKSVVYMTTNEGYLHAIDHQTGEENYAFMPKELLQNLRRLYENNATRNRPYGLDGGMTLWIDETDNNGVVNSGDKAYLYMGMRRGGDLYYALDISNPTKPKFVWSIKGGVTTLDTSEFTADGDFEELGDTWSKPLKSKIYDGSKELDVLIFGAGYDPNQDPRTNTSTSSTSTEVDVRRVDGVGRGVFIVNAKTGDLVWKTNLADNNKLEYSVPSDIRVIDINFDGMADQLYFGDMGGQVWRMDINNDEDFSGSIDNRITWGVIGSFAGSSEDSARRFYYPPDIAILNIDGEQQLSVSIGSGWRAHPLNTAVQDRFYSFRMTGVYGAPIDSQGNIRYSVVREDTTGMHDVTDSIDNELNKEQRGWYIDMNQPGEKVLSSSVTANNQVIFTSYIPANSSQGCAAAEGNGAVYALDLENGNPVADLDNSGSDNLTESDRRKPLASVGIPPGPTILFPESGKATVVVGRETLQEVELDSLRKRTFWQEYIDENL